MQNDSKEQGNRTSISRTGDIVFSNTDGVSALRVRERHYA